MIKRKIVIPFLIILTGCGGSTQEGVVCTASLEPGIVVVIRDSVTDAPLAENAVVVIAEDDYRETLVVNGYEGPDSSSAFSVAGAFERAGTYDISLTLDGYNSWSRAGVEVTSGICHVGTVTFTARLDAL